MLIPMMTIGTAASSAYQTYTYSIDGSALILPMRILPRKR